MHLYKRVLLQKYLIVGVYSPNKYSSSKGLVKNQTEKGQMYECMVKLHVESYGEVVTNVACDRVRRGSNVIFLCKLN